MHNLKKASFVAAGCAAAVALPGWHLEQPGPDVAELRALGPTALPPLLAQYDAMAPGPERDALALTIDTVAGQRYATVSRLYWYTDLGAAEAAAHAQGKPILSLRMLGRLDEDLSCANSRLFRSTLYANHDVAALLRDRFILHWSSERPVPQVTIDFGDGRKLERTVTGNSAHYVLDDTGRVLDVLPGLYSATAFTAELGASLELASRIRKLPVAKRADAVAEHQNQLAMRASQEWLASAPPVAIAQARTVTKAVIERRDLGRYARELDASAVPDDSERWFAVGQAMYGQNATTAAANVLDGASKQLVVALHTANGTVATTPDELAAMLGRLQRSVIADTALNQLKLRPLIAKRIVETRGKLDFDSLNAWIYSEVFRTPASDRWLGLLPRTDFTGLPGDGVVTR
jgi:hypothetical protein